MRPREGRDEAHDGLEQAGLARAVGAHQGHGLTQSHLQIESEQRLGGAIVHRQVIDAEQGNRGGSGHISKELYMNPSHLNREIVDAGVAAGRGLAGRLF